MDVEKFRAMFLEEAEEHLQAMVANLLKLDADPDSAETIDALFREAHSIKGMAATMEYHETARLAHHLEDQLDRCRQGQEIKKSEIDRFLEATDLLEALFEDIRERRPERNVDGYITSADVSEGTLSSPTPDLDGEEDFDEQGILLRLTLKPTTAAPEARLLVLLKWFSEQGTVLQADPSEEKLLNGEAKDRLSVRLLTALSQQELTEQLRSFSEIQDLNFPSEASEKREKVSYSAQTLRVKTDLLDHLINQTGELITNRYQLQNAAKTRDWRALDDAISQLSGVVKTLHHHVLKVRMVALESLTGRISRTLHDLCRSSGKDIRLTFEGLALELDRAIVEGLVAPLGHLIRNAVDHGIPERGEVAIKAWRERDQVMLQISDDGVGLDPDNIRLKAIEQGLLSASQAKVIREYDLFQMICQPGFSTAEEVTETSGRGVGMDVVKTAVENLGGVLLIDSRPGEGTQMTLKLPLTLSIIRVLMVRCEDMVMAMPITRVVQTLELHPDEIQSSGKQLMIKHQDELLPLLSLRKILKQPKGSRTGLVPVVLTDIMGRRVGLVVDQLVRQQEIFVQRIPEPFDRIRGCAGGTILGDGTIVFLLDLQSLLEKRKT